MSVADFNSFVSTVINCMVGFIGFTNQIHIGPLTLFWWIIAFLGFLTAISIIYAFIGYHGLPTLHNNHDN